MKLSVIIPVYNEEHVILSCLNSLEKQTMSDFEVIIVDDGSTDSTFSLLKQFKTNKYKMHVLLQSHKGPAAARNYGSSKAKGSILVFVDSDMTFEENFLKFLVVPIIKGESIGTFSRNEFVSNWKLPLARCWNWNLNLPDKNRLPSNYPESQKVFRAILKKEFDRVGGFSSGGYTDDWSLSSKLNRLAVNAPDATFYHSNPQSLYEVFIQARWIGKRDYKFGIVGVFYALFRSNILFSLYWGILKSIIHKDSHFLIFKIVYDLGISIGIISYVVTKKGSK